MTQKNIIKNYLQYVGNWIPGNALANCDSPYGFLSERAPRTARSLAAKGEIERKIDTKNGKQIVFYRPLQPKSFITYKVEGEIVAKVAQY